MRNLKMLAVLAALATAPAVASADNCHTETRYRPVTTYETRTVMQPVTEPWCGINAWGYYVCTTITHMVATTVTVPVTTQEAYTVTVCE